MYRPTKYFKTVKFFIFYIGFLSAILNCQFQTNRTLKAISLHFNGTSHSVQGPVIVRGEICLFQFVTLLFIDIY